MALQFSSFEYFWLVLLGLSAAVFVSPGRPLKALVSLDEALRALQSLASPIQRTERVRLLDALRRVAAEDVVSGIHVPLVDRAAMDGYAVQAVATYRAGKFRPVILRCVETLYADSVPRRHVVRGTCVEVATGASVPAGRRLAW